MSTTETNPALLLERTREWLGTLRDRGLAAEGTAGRLEAVLSQSRAERLDAVDDPLLVVMLCGPTAVGKSSLVNALAGAEISRPGLGATTSAGVVYVHERDDTARLFEYGEALGQLGRKAATVVRHSRDELLHKVLVDTPDIDSVMRGHREVTEALVHCADLVLFVTSPEKYKAIEGMRWVAGQRHQRATAFVLNKWDRSALGVQHAHRRELERDFRAMLDEAGFSEPMVFRVSALDGDAEESQLRALRAWLEAGLDASAAKAIQERRRRAAWGRLAAAIAPAIPALPDPKPLLDLAEQVSEAGCDRAICIVRAEAATLAVGRGGLRPRPETPGLLGAWLRLVDRVGNAGTALRSWVSGRGAAGLVWSALGGRDRGSEDAAFLTGPGFGRPVSTLLANAAARLTREAETSRFPLGPVAAQWSDEARQLSDRLDALPAEAEAEVIAAALRPSLRRVAGLAVMITVEALLALVLLFTLWRLGSGFVVADYAPASALLFNGFALCVVLLLLGQTAVGAIFPALRERVCRVVAQRSEAVMEAAWRRFRSALEGQMEAADRLARQGHRLLADIDSLLRSLPAAAPSGTELERLFGEASPGLSGYEPAMVDADGDADASPPRRRRPVFD